MEGEKGGNAQEADRMTATAFCLETVGKPWTAEEKPARVWDDCEMVLGG